MENNLIKHGKGKVLSLVIVLIITMIPMAGFALTPSDTSNHWAGDVINEWVNNNMASGYPDGTFRPEDPITRAEFMALVNNAFDYTVTTEISFTDVKPGAWYEDVVKKGVKAGYTLGYPDGTIKPLANISRQEVAAIISKIKNLQGDISALEGFNDKAQISNWSKVAVAGVVEAGYMQGYPDNTFKPTNNIKRGEALVALNKVILEDIVVFDQKGTFGSDKAETIESDVIIKADGVVLENYIIKGNLIIAEEVGNGTVTLNNITVEGETFVRGGGTDSVVINGGKFNKITLQKTSSGAVRIVATDIEGLDVVVSEAALGDSIVLEGTFNEIVVKAEKVVVETKGETKIQSMTIAPESKGAVVKVQENTTVQKMEVAASIKVEGKGKIKEAVVKANDVSFAKKPEKQTVSEGIEAPKVEESDNTSSGGGGGGGSSTPSLTVTNINMVVNGQTNGGKDLSTLDDTTRVSGIKFKVNHSNSTMKMTGLYSPRTGEVSSNKTINFTSNIAEVAVKDLLGFNQESVSLGTLRGFFGNKVTIKGQLTASGHTSYTEDIVITLGGEVEDDYRDNDWATVEQDGNNITATIKAGQGNTLLKTIGVATFINDTFNQLPSEVKIGNNSWIDDFGDYTTIKTQLAVLGNTTWDDLKISDLAGKTIKFKASSSEDIYTLTIEE